MEELSHEEKRAMGKLSEEKFDMTNIEAKISKTLASKGLLISKKQNTMKKTIYQIAASVVILVSGYLIGITPTNFNIDGNKSMYALFLYENDAFTVAEPEELIEEYKQWAVDLGKQDKLVYAEKLDDLKDHWLGDAAIRNSTSKLSGYFVFYADNFSEAKAIAATHPHTSYGGGLELRPVDTTNQP